MALTYCKRCGGTISDTAFYCVHCGEPLKGQKILCPSCSSEIRYGAKYCTNCGRNLNDIEWYPKDLLQRAAQSVKSNTVSEKNCADDAIYPKDFPTLPQNNIAKDPSKCCKCGRPVFTLATGKVSLLDGLLCGTCYQSLGFSTFDTDTIMKCKTKTYAQVLDFSRRRMKDHNIAQFFVATYAPAPYCKFNDRTGKILVSDKTHLSYKPEHYTVFTYDQIISYELLEDGSSIASGGLGRAAVGGLLFGGVGAVVGGLTRGYKGSCTRLQIKLTVKDYEDPAFFITLINSSTKKDSISYKTYIKEAETILSKLQLIIGAREEAKSNKYTNEKTISNESIADQIRSFKALLDEGIITQEEFEKKKKQLLGI